MKETKWWLCPPLIPREEARKWVYKLIKEYTMLKKENLRLQGIVMDYKQQDEMRGE